MNENDALYGRIKNGVLTISGNNSRITVDGGCLSISDGAYDQSASLRLRRADCPLSRIVVTRPDGIISFAAIKWLHGVGAGLVQLDWDGTVLLATAPAGTDQPALRRAQALAAGNEIGRAITRELLRAKLHGQAEVARFLLRSNEVAALIDKMANELDEATDFPRLLALEAIAATAYWPLWHSLPLQFARRQEAPEHWHIFGNRHSPLTGKPLKAASPGNAILNYLYAVLVGEMTIALAGAGLDPGIGIFHVDTVRRASLAYDAGEAVRPHADAWLAAWLSTARFSKRDFYEEADGAIRLTRPLTSHLAMTAAIWRPAAQAVAAWLARALAIRLDGRRGLLLLPLPVLPAPKRTWQGSEPPLVRTCHECGKALAPTRRKFCSETCAIAFHLATTTAEALSELPGSAQSGGAISKQGSGDKSRRHLALRRAWDAEHAQPAASPLVRKRNTWTTASGTAVDQLRDWFTTTVSPLIAKCPIAEIRRSTGFPRDTSS